MLQTYVFECWAGKSGNHLARQQPSMQYPCPCLSVNAASMASKCARTQPKSLWKHTAYPNREVHVHMFWCRELAQQVAGEARNLRGVWGLRVAAVFGGADKAQQVKLACRRHAPQPAVGTHRQRPTVVARAALAVLRARLMNALRSCVQVELLGKKPHVLVATPGRLLDLADSGAVSLGAHTLARICIGIRDLNQQAVQQMTL